MPVRKTTVINLCGIAQHTAIFFRAYQRYGGTPTACTFISKAFGISNESRAYLENFHVSKKFMVYAPSPIHLHKMVCPVWSKLPPEKVNASSVKSFKTLLDAHWQPLFPEVTI